MTYRFNDPRFTDPPLNAEEAAAIIAGATRDELRAALTEHLLDELSAAVACQARRDRRPDTHGFRPYERISAARTALQGMVMRPDILPVNIAAATPDVRLDLAARIRDNDWHGRTNPPSAHPPALAAAFQPGGTSAEAASPPAPSAGTNARPRAAARATRPPPSAGARRAR